MFEFPEQDHAFLLPEGIQQSASESASNLATGRDIAAALHMNYAFVCEFEELRSPLRTERTQVELHFPNNSLPSSELYKAVHVCQRNMLWQVVLQRLLHGQGGGFHGNAILSRWDFSDSRAIEHR